MTTAKATGIVRKLDELGRVVIPIELRRTLGIGKKDPVNHPAHYTAGKVECIDAIEAATAGNGPLNADRRGKPHKNSKRTEVKIHDQRSLLSHGWP